jgi:hypothetical protein
MVGYRVLQKSPSEFFLQPHAMYPMSVEDFAHWLAVFRGAFPSDDRLRSEGVFSYPGDGGDQLDQFRSAREIGRVGSYRLSLSNNSPDDKRVRVCVQGKGEAHFWFDPVVELDCCYFGFDETELQTIRELVAERAPDVRQSWQRFSSEAQRAQARWLSMLKQKAGSQETSHRDD